MSSGQRLRGVHFREAHEHQTELHSPRPFTFAMTRKRRNRWKPTPAPSPAPIAGILAGLETPTPASVLPDSLEPVDKRLQNPKPFLWPAEGFGDVFLSTALTEVQGNGLVAEKFLTGIETSAQTAYETAMKNFEDSVDVNGLDEDSIQRLTTNAQRAASKLFKETRDREELRLKETMKGYDDLLERRAAQVEGLCEMIPTATAYLAVTATLSN